MSQANTEVYLLDLSFSEEHFEISNFRNISNNEGYDNQPSFSHNGILFFAKTRNGQTDIALFDPKLIISQWMHPPSPGGEYSPQQIGISMDATAVRLDTDGKQRLYRYGFEVEPTEYIKDLRVAYYAHYDENTLLSSVLSGDNLDLVISDIPSQKSDTLLEGSGRSIHKFPNSEAMSYTSVNEEGNWDVYQLDIKSRESFFVTQLPIGIQDHIWLDDSKLLIGSGSKLFLYDLFGDGQWKEVADLSEYKIDNITRMAVNSSGQRLALVAEAPSSSNIVAEHITLYNEGNPDSYINTLAQDIVVRNFPDDTLYTDRSSVRSNYELFRKNDPSLRKEAPKQIVYKNAVVNEELVIANNKTIRQATVYEIENGTIAFITYIAPENEGSESPEIIVDKQLEAYNNRDIDAFMATYTDSVKLYSFPNEFLSEGQEAMKGNYASFFERTPDLNCTVKNRIVIGNKVIDEEFLTINGNNYAAIAIYEVENGLISKVTFIQ
ncbi:MAG: hypothetical protein Aureis2KO_14250 [Aureisphaera sp.]